MIHLGYYDGLCPSAAVVVPLRSACDLDIPFSALELAPIRRGGSAPESFPSTLSLARHIEPWGYGASGSPNTAASRAWRIRVGSGAIMLPNHAPLVIAKQFGFAQSRRSYT